jgi:threonine dehydrogenase-like Zn-dependent dehydrogenase
MNGVRLPGGRRVEHVTVPVPEPGPGQVLLAMRASSICGSDLRAIYREHLGHGAEAYRGVIAGHEPCGEVVATGPGVRLSVGDGGHADHLLAEERSCLPLPDSLSFVDGALVSCGFGTAWEALLRLGVSGRDGLLVTGLGPVGLAAAMLGRALGAGPVYGVDPVEGRRDFALELGLVDAALPADDATLDRLQELTDGRGLSATVDCSGAASAREVAVRATARWGRCAFVGEGGTAELDVSQWLIHKQVSLHGSWVTSLPHMLELLDRLDTWELHPERVVSHRFSLADAASAYEAADRGSMGKVCLVWQ